VANEPELLLLDEPTNGLDRWGVRALVAAVGRAVEGGSVVVVVTHDVQAFGVFAVRRFVLEAGRVVGVDG
jgi:energy-coupling factor transporter ATP-binding protein EcfA2